MKCLSNLAIAPAALGHVLKHSCSLPLLATGVLRRLLWHGKFAVGQPFESHPALGRAVGLTAAPVSYT